MAKIFFIFFSYPKVDIYLPLLEKEMLCLLVLKNDVNNLFVHN